jgi:hypothetical protein
LPAAAVPPLLSVAKLLQCIANEQVENKITMTGIGKEKIEEFIKEHIAPIRAYTARLVVRYHDLTKKVSWCSPSCPTERERSLCDEENGSHKKEQLVRGEDHRREQPESNHRLYHIN